MSDLQPGDVLRARYEVEEGIGEGAMGVVYRVRDRMDGTRRALKVANLDAVDAAEVDETRALFEREARFLVGLNHRGFPRVYDYFTDGPRCCQVMDLIEGDTLDARVERAGPLGDDEALDLARQLSGHLQFLHEHASGVIVYRDLKPSNVMLGSDGVIYVIDFGITRVYKPDENRDTQFLGTPGYAAPELYGGRQSTPSSDMYAFGATLRFALTGEHPVPGLAPPPSPTGSAVVAMMAHRCMAVDPGARMLASSVKELCTDAAIPARSTFDLRAIARWMRRRFLRFPVRSFHCGRFDFITIAAIVIVAIAISGNLFGVFGREDETIHAVSCGVNLRKLGTALETYASREGRFPPNLARLSPGSLTSFPVCPSARRDTYASGYEVSPKLDAYTVYCKGFYHHEAGYPQNHPQITSRSGFVDR